MLFTLVITAFYIFYVFLEYDKILCSRGGLFIYVIRDSINTCVKTCFVVSCTSPYSRLSSTGYVPHKLGRALVCGTGYCGFCVMHQDRQHPLAISKYRKIPVKMYL